MISTNYHTHSYSIMKTKLGNSPLRALNGTGEKIDIHGRKMSRRIEYIPTNRLKPNPLNSRYFRELTIDEFQNLVENIRVNGIHTPLIARQDYTLIAGHNRLEAAKELDLQHVPVQFIEEEMTERDEILFIIADNLLRRHLTNSEKIDLYRVLFPEFEKRISIRPNTHGASVDIVHNPDVKPLTAAEIAKSTGQTKEAVQKQLQRYETQLKRENLQNRQSQAEVARFSAEHSAEMQRAKERTAEQAIKSALDELAYQLSREDLTAEFKANVFQKVLRAVERTQKLISA